MVRREYKRRVVGVVLGGGVGSRLRPLTRFRSKPAVPLAGKYRLVDVPLSNCINSGINQIYLLTQYNSVSLHRHIQSSYSFDKFGDGFVNLLAAEQTPDSTTWFQGTADAVRQSIHHITYADPEFIVILSGDQLYRMDLRKVLDAHLESGADVTISTKPVSQSLLGEYGIMCLNNSGAITHFQEKPDPSAERVDDLRVPGMEREAYLASMGIYIFNTPVLLDVLKKSKQFDFGKHIIPEVIERYNVRAHIFDGFWRDIGKIGSFWETHLSLTEPLPEFSFYDAGAPIYTNTRYLPPTKVNHCALSNCLLSEGSIISGERVSSSVIGLRSRVCEGSVVGNSVVMGSDYYDFNDPKQSLPLGIGRDCWVEKTILDKNVRIGDGAYLSPDGREDMESDLFAIRDGIMVIPKNSVIPPGTRL